MGFFDFFRRNKMRDRVLFTDDAVTHIRADGVKETVRWNELREVGILTTEEGPFQEDVFLLLLGEDEKSGCVAPQCSEGFDKLFARLGKLPGFDYAAAIKAMGSTSNAKFVCWKR